MTFTKMVKLTIIKFIYFENISTHTTYNGMSNKNTNEFNNKNLNLKKIKEYILQKH